MTRAGLAILVAMTVAVTDAAAAEQPISATKLMLRHSSSGREKLTFTSKDPAFLFPALGSADDPSAGGLVVELFAPSSPLGVALAAPAGVGNPGWSSKAGPPPRLQFKNGDAPDALSSFRSIALRAGKTIKLNGKQTGLSVAAPLGSVGIRITTGSLINCAFFAASTVRRDEGGTFLAKDALASALADCSDASLAGATTTTSTTGTTTTVPATCGDNVVNQASEQCDGTDRADCEGLDCGPPGYATACLCCGSGTGTVPTFPSDVIPCCDPTATPVYFPSVKQCVSTHCNEAFDCSLGSCQPDGSCCAGVGGTCAIAGGGGTGAAVPCCDPTAVCSFSFPTGTCCKPTGGGCTGDFQCCGGSCVGGTCAAP
jgi:hypothetical protein